MKKKIFVGNLSWRVTEEHLAELFKEQGNIASVKLITDPFTGKSRGFGFVEMATTDEADLAIEKLNGALFMERNIRVNEAHQKATT